MKKTFNQQEITIRELSKKDLKRAKEFQQYINSLIKEDAKILMNKEISLKEEKVFLQDQLKQTKASKRITLVAEYNNKIIAITTIKSGRWRKSHIGDFGISIKKEYRGIGLGIFMMGEVIKLAKKKMKPNVKILHLGVYPNNKPARALYRLHGFKAVARISKQISYKGKLLDEIIMLRNL